MDVQAHVAALEAAELQFKMREEELEREVTQLKENAKQMSALKEKEQAKKDETIASLSTRLEESEENNVNLQAHVAALEGAEFQFKTREKELEREVTELKENAKQMSVLKEKEQAKKDETIASLRTRLKESEVRYKKLQETTEQELQNSQVACEMEKAHEQKKAELLERVYGLQLELKQTRKDNNTKVRNLENKLSVATAKVKKVASAEIGIQHTDDYLIQKFMEKIRAGKEELRIAEDTIKTMNENLDALSVDLGAQERKISEMHLEMKDLSNNKKEAEKIAEIYHRQNEFLLEEKNTMRQKMIEQQKSLKYTKWNFKRLRQKTYA